MKNQFPLPLEFWESQKKLVKLLQDLYCFFTRLFSKRWIFDCSKNSSNDNIKKFVFYNCQLKFSFSEKAKKFGVITHLIWRLARKRQIKWVITPNFCGLLREAELYLKISESLILIKVQIYNLINDRWIIHSTLFRIDLWLERACKCQVFSMIWSCR